MVQTNSLFNYNFFQKMNKKFLSGVIALIFAGAFLRAQEASYNLDEVVVTATRMSLPWKNIPQKVEIIDSKKIATVPAENAAELLKRVTNIDIIQYPGMSASIGMRGFSPTAHSRSYTLLLIDGIPSGTTNLTSIPTSMIERIEIVKGPYSVLYGSDAMGGVINVITRTVTDSGAGQIGVSGGSFGQFKFNLYANVPLSRRLAFSFGMTREVQTGDYFIGRRNLLSIGERGKLMLDKASYGDTLNNSKYNTNQVSTKLNYLISDKWSASFASFFTLNRNVEMPGTYWHSTADSKKDLGRVNLQGQIRRSAGNHLLTVSPYFSSDREEFFDNLTEAGFVNLIGKTKEYGVKAGNTSRFGNLSLLTGVDYDVYDYRSQRFKDANIPDAPYQPDNRNRKFSALAQLAYSAGRLSANAGLRYNFITYGISENADLQSKDITERYYNFTPSAGVQFRVIDGLKLHSSFGKAFSVPDAFKIAGDYKVEIYFPEWDYFWKTVYVSNPDLKPETSATWDAGISYGNEAVNLDVSYFSTRHRNKIIRDPETSGDTVRHINSEKAFMNGLELIGSIDLGALAGSRSKVEVYAGFTALFNANFTGRIKSDATVATRDLQYVRKTNGNFGIFFDTNRKFSARLHARYIGKRLEDDAFGAARPEIKESDYYVEGGYAASDKVLQLPAHLVFDCSAHYHVTPKVRAGISVSNLLDENYTEKDGYNMSGRSITGSVTYSF
jgi:vitamin B12 transporter